MFAFQYIIFIFKGTLEIETESGKSNKIVIFHTINLLKYNVNII